MHKNNMYKLQNSCLVMGEIKKDTDSADCVIKRIWEGERQELTFFITLDISLIKSRSSVATNTALILSLFTVSFTCLITVLSDG